MLYCLNPNIGCHILIQIRKRVLFKLIYGSVLLLLLLATIYLICYIINPPDSAHFQNKLQRSGPSVTEPNVSHVAVETWIFVSSREKSTKILSISASVCNWRQKTITVFSCCCLLELDLAIPCESFWLQLNMATFSQPCISAWTQFSSFPQTDPREADLIWCINRRPTTTSLLAHLQTDYFWWTEIKTGVTCKVTKWLGRQY